jgi:hypothetical protein
MVLVAAVLVLLASVGTAIAVAASRDQGSLDQPKDYASRYDTDRGTRNSWMSDPNPGGRGSGSSMMGERGDGYGWMMGPQSSGQGWTGHGPGSSWSGDAWGHSRSYRWNGTGPVTAAQAREVAQRWLDRYATSARLGDRVAMPMGYRFLGSQGGTVVAMIMVDDDTGTLTGHLRSTVRR